MITLGIETSCDETAVSILDYKGEVAKPVILSELISSQIKLHQEYGGVVPELAAREHLKSLPLLFNEALKEAKLNISDVENIAVTAGPGLKGCLLMGYHFAEGISVANKIPITKVHHIEGHVFAIALEEQNFNEPFIALVVSGGHTEIILVESFGNYKVLARTIDDAAGEAFDKSANLLGIPYPGGAELSKLASKVNASDFTLPKVMRGQEGFSFSGLKTAISLLIKKNKDFDKKVDLKRELAFTIENAIVDNLVYKLEQALAKSSVKKIVVCGGVAANSKLRNAVSKLKVQSFFPKPLYCTDNASMIAYVGARRRAKNLDSSLKEVTPRLSLEDL